jgi:putative ABC transport system permease protein
MGNIEKIIEIRLILSITALLFLTIVFACVSGIFYSEKGNFSDRVEINLKAENYSDGKLIGLLDIERIKQRLGKCDISYMNEFDSFAQANNKIFPVKACLTDNEFILFSDIRIVKGCFFNGITSLYSLNAAVISKELAEKLFGTYDVIGSKFELFSEKYKVIGLYENRKSALSFLSSDGIDRIYVPFKSHPSFKDISLKTIFLRDEALKAKGLRENYVKNLFKIDNRVYKITDFYNKWDISMQLNGFFIFIVGLWCILIVARCIMDYSKSGYVHIKKSLEKIYLKEMLIKEKGFLLRWFLIILSSVTAMIIIFFISRCEINIPEEYIPLDNIFDLSYYFEELKAYIHDVNLSAGYIPTYLETYFNNVMRIKSVVEALFIVSFFSVLSNIKLINQVSCTKKNTLKVLTVPFALTFILSLMFSLLSGIDYCFPLKVIGTIYIFLFFKIRFNVTSITKKG